MKDYFTTLSSWLQEEKAFAMATVIKTWGSSPRPIGSTMLISKDMEMLGSVSGGCVEVDVLKKALPIIENGQAEKLAYGITNEEAWGVGLSCGGKIEVYLEKFMAFKEQSKEVWKELNNCLERNMPCVLLTQINSNDTNHILVKPTGEVIGHSTANIYKEIALKAYKERRHQLVEIGEEQFFAKVFPRKSQLLIIGSAHISVDLVDLAKKFNFETIVIDPRTVFAEKTNFKTPPDQIIAKYPNEVLNDFPLDAFNYAVILSHDPKIDDNALQILLKSKVAYIGALGSRKTQAKRVERLKAASFTDTEIARIHAPVGVDINAKKPAEIALSIMAEIIQVQNEFM